MAAERNFFHRWRGMTTIGYELGVIWEMSVIHARRVYIAVWQLIKTAPVNGSKRIGLLFFVRKI